MKYLRKAWDIEKQDIEKLKDSKESFKPNAKTRLTRNFIFDYYTAQFIEAVKNGDNKTRHYYDNEILGNLISYDKLSKNVSYKYIT